MQTRITTSEPPPPPPAAHLVSQRLTEDKPISFYTIVRSTGKLHDFVLVTAQCCEEDASFLIRRTITHSTLPSSRQPRRSFVRKIFLAALTLSYSVAPLWPLLVLCKICPSQLRVPRCPEHSTDRDCFFYRASALKKLGNDLACHVLV